MILEPYYLSCLSHASYLVGDAGAGVAAVIDPQRDVERYLEDAAARGLRITHVLLTHLHADFVAGHLELRERTGAEIAVGAEARARYPHRALHDGDTIELGAVSLRVLATPGHTPESVCYLATERGGPGPGVLFSGDTLFVGDVGRPDLMASVGRTADELARLLHRSLREKLLTLPDDTIVYPAHGAGSMCGKNLGSETSTTIGIQRRLNPALQPMEVAEFVALVTADQPEAPAYFGHDAQLNRLERPTLDHALARELVPLSLARVLDLRQGGAIVLDVRDQDDFHREHLAGSLNVGLDGKFATWAGTVLPIEGPVLVVADPGREREAMLRLGRIGIDRVEGYLEGGSRAWEGRPELLGRTERIRPAELEARLAGPGAPPVLDVRTPGERSGGRIRGSVHIPLPQLVRRLGELPTGRPLVIHCQGGYRSSLAWGLLRAQGVTGLLDLEGGFAAWAEAGLPIEGEGAATCARGGS